MFRSVFERFRRDQLDRGCCFGRWNLAPINLVGALDAEDGELVGMLIYV
jgi:hypothetical protein